MAMLWWQWLSIEKGADGWLGQCQVGGDSSAIAS